VRFGVRSSSIAAEIFISCNERIEYVSGNDQTSELCVPDDRHPPACLSRGGYGTNVAAIMAQQLSVHTQTEVIYARFLFALSCLFRWRIGNVARERQDRRLASIFAGSMMKRRPSRMTTPSATSWLSDALAFGREHSTKSAMS
jgi:hypothetical protein